MTDLRRYKLFRIARRLQESAPKLEAHKRADFFFRNYRRVNRILSGQGPFSESNP